MYCGGRGFIGSGRSKSKALSTAARSGPSNLTSDNWDLSQLDKRLVRGINPLGARSQVSKKALVTSPHEAPKPPSPSDPLPPQAVIPAAGSRKPEDLAGILSLGSTIKHSTINERCREVCRFCFRPVKFDGGAEQHLLKCTAITGMPLSPDLAKLSMLPAARPIQRPTQVGRKPNQIRVATTGSSRLVIRLLAGSTVIVACRNYLGLLY